MQFEPKPNSVLMEVETHCAGVYYCSESHGFTISCYLHVLVSVQTSTSKPTLGNHRTPCNSTLSWWHFVCFPEKTIIPYFRHGFTTDLFQKNYVKVTGAGRCNGTYHWFDRYNKRSCYRSTSGCLIYFSQQDWSPPVFSTFVRQRTRRETLFAARIPVGESTSNRISTASSFKPRARWAFRLHPAAEAEETVERYLIVLRCIHYAGPKWSNSWDGLPNLLMCSLTLPVTCLALGGPIAV